MTEQRCATCRWVVRVKYNSVPEPALYCDFFRLKRKVPPWVFSEHRVAGDDGQNCPVWEENEE